MSDARIVEVIALEIAPWMKHTIGAVNAAQGVLAALRAEGFEWYPVEGVAEEWWCLTHVLPGDRDLNDPDAMKRRCFAHRLNWDRPTWTRLKCRMVRRTVLVPVETPKENE